MVLIILFVTVSIAQWLERRPPNPAVVGSSPGRDRHICACHVEVKLPPDKKGYAWHKFFLLF